MLSFLRKWTRILLGFSGRETNGFLILLPLVLLIVFSEPIYRMIIVHREIDFTNDEKKLDSLVALWEVKKKDSVVSEKRERKFFSFNPNTVSAEELTQLGFSESLAKRIVVYRQKGGTFRIRSDFRKIYGLDSAFYTQLERYISLPEAYAEKKKFEHQKAFVQRPKEHFAPFNLNLADTVQLKSVYGIGTKLAERIVRFRETLGGFVEMYQLREIYGLDSAVVEKLTQRSFIAEDFIPKKININNATEKQLSAHPYLRKGIAKAIVAWRFQHGRFHDTDQIRNLNIFKEDEINRILPYLKVDD